MRPNLTLVLLATLTFPASGRGQANATVDEISPNYAWVLVRVPEVSADLRLSTSQREGIETLKRRLDEEYRPRFEAAQRTGRSGGEPSFGKLVGEYWREADARVFALLNGAQRERLRALQYQSLGFRALLLKDLRDRLGLRKDQVASVDRLARRTAVRRNECASVVVFTFGSPRSKGASTPEPSDGIKERNRRQWEQIGRNVADVERKAETEVMALLTDDQATRYRRLLGVRLSSVEGTSPSVSMIHIG